MICYTVCTQGEIDEAQALLEEVAAMRKEKQEIENQFTQIKTTKRNIVCEVRGGLVSSILHAYTICTLLTLPALYECTCQHSCRHP
jgi:dethiobiotin synthetase